MTEIGEEKIETSTNFARVTSLRKINLCQRITITTSWSLGQSK